jgi:hypothetical protein
MRKRSRKGVLEQGTAASGSGSDTSPTEMAEGKFLGVLHDAVRDVADPDSDEDV